MNDNERELDSIVEKALASANETATKKAVDTLHPLDLQHADRLTILSDEEIAAHTIMEWVTMVFKTEDLTKGFIMEDFSNKIKALKVSRNGTGRSEISNIFKPEIIGNMMQGGMIPINSPQQQQPEKRGLFQRRLF